MSFLDRIFGKEREDEPVRGDPERVRVVRAVLDELAPAIAADGGKIELVAVEDDGWVLVRLQGACTHCHVSDTTLQGAVEPKLRARASWVRGVRTA